MVTDRSLFFTREGKGGFFKGRPTLCVRRPKNTTGIVIPSRPYRLSNARNKLI